MSIVVAGARGQLGGELCRQLGDDAVGLDIDDLDLTDGPAVLATLQRLRLAAVINCAAYTQVDRAEAEFERCRAVNATAVEHLARACGELDCPLVQISTDYVFGGAGDSTGTVPVPADTMRSMVAKTGLSPSAGDARPLGFREDDPPAPQGVYATTKFEGERAAARHPKHLIVRTCGLYARPSDARAGNFVKTMLRLGGGGQPLRVVADQHCTPSYVPHVARAVLFLLRCETRPWGIYHVTNRGQTTWCEFAAEIFRLAGMDVRVQPITTAEYAAAAPRPAYSVLDTSAYHRLGGPPMPDWQAALAEYFAERESLRTM
jgi:dTDP-4-dehydrorhamnose reductase